MKIMQVGELKARFSEVVEEVRNGEEIVVSYGRKQEHVAVLVPYSKYEKRNRIKLGLLKDRGSVVFAEDFEITDEELLEG